MLRFIYCKSLLIVLLTYLCVISTADGAAYQIAGAEAGQGTDTSADRSRLEYSCSSEIATAGRSFHSIAGECVVLIRCMCLEAIIHFI